MPAVPAIFVHAWFRSGSTYVWSKLREIPALTCYYEPLHEDIPTLDPDALEAESNVEEARSLNHPPPKRHYFYEFAGLLRSGKLRHHPDISYRRYFLGSHDSDPALQDYLSDLIADAAAQNRTATLCFCRSQMRVAWMRQRFPGLHVVQIRNPLSQWDSFIQRPYFAARLLTSTLVLFRRFPSLAKQVRGFRKVEDFFSIQRFQDNPLLALTPSEMQYLFLVNWLVSSAQSMSHSDLLIDIDTLSKSVSYQQQCGAAFGAYGVEVSFPDCTIESTPLASMRRETEGILDAAVAAIRPLQAELCIDPDGARRLLAGVDEVSLYMLRRLLG